MYADCVCQVLWKLDHVCRKYSSPNLARFSQTDWNYSKQHTLRIKLYRSASTFQVHYPSSFFVLWLHFKAENSIHFLHYVCTALLTIIIKITVKSLQARWIHIAAMNSILAISLTLADVSSSCGVTGYSADFADNHFVSPRLSLVTSYRLRSYG